MTLTSNKHMNIDFCAQNLRCFRVTHHHTRQPLIKHYEAIPTIGPNLNPYHDRPDLAGGGGGVSVTWSGYHPSLPLPDQT